MAVETKEREACMVHFVGAGSGATDLITVRGKGLLEQADVVIYAGSLVNPALLGFCREDAKIFNSAEMHLDEVLDVMKANRDAEVVRLHTGDPSIYGAIREQMDALDALGIAYDVTPGVSSFFAAAASVGCEYTLPGISQTVIITRMEGRTPVPEGQQLAKLAVHGASMVIFLSASMTGKVQEALLSGSYNADTPAAIVYKASWPEEKICRCRLADLDATAKQAGISKTALILVGDFLGDTPNYEKSKLYDATFTTEYRKGI